MSEVVLPVAEDGIRLTEKQLRRRRARSVAIAVTLAVLVALFYAVTIVRIGGNIAGRPL
ncbi:MAG: hypothetical protein ABI399_11230 [Bauldia sp.]